MGFHREYLNNEMRVANYACVGGFNLERVIDDFILLVRLLYRHELSYFIFLVLANLRGSMHIMSCAGYYSIIFSLTLAILCVVLLRRQ